MINIDQYAQQSGYSDPREFAPLFETLPTNLDEMTAVVRNLLVHYRAGGVTLSPDRMAEIDNRWIDRLLDTDQRRFDAPLNQPRPEADHVAGCCRDYSLLMVSALRHRGIPARTRIGFAGYFDSSWHHDHVIVDYWNGDRWVFLDPELEPAGPWTFDRLDMPRLAGARTGKIAPPVQPFVTSAQVWTAFRRGEIDDQVYGVAPSHEARGGWFIRGYVLGELAHRQRDELLLWDLWGDMQPNLDGDLSLIDDIAALLLAADAGDESAERELATRYSADTRLHPGDQVLCLSPTGRTHRIDLRTRSEM